MPTHVLVIDDDPAVTELLTLLLKTTGFDVSAVNRAEDGVQLLRDQHPDLLLLDLMMPGMDGWETCRAVRAFSNVPIIILSALNDPDLVARALDLGADDYLTKPAPSTVLVAHINKLVRRTGSLKLPAQNAPGMLPGTQAIPSSS